MRVVEEEVNVGAGGGGGTGWMAAATVPDTGPGGGSCATSGCIVLHLVVGPLD